MIVRLLAHKYVPGEQADTQYSGDMCEQVEKALAEWRKIHKRFIDAVNRLDQAKVTG